MAKILFGITGSIAAYKAAECLSRLVQEGHEVQTVISSSCKEFIGAATLEGLTGKKTFSSIFEEGRCMDHIWLTKWADIFVIAPATAETINSLASGFGANPMSTLFLAWDFAKPFLLAPAMNTRMLENPVTQKSFVFLESMGVQFVDPQSGRLACGDTGSGKMAEPSEILKSIDISLNIDSDPIQQKMPLRKSLRILITSGGTREPIDAVRSITNFSTGKTGAFLSDFFTQRGHLVTLLRAQESISPQQKPGQDISYSDYDSLYQKMKIFLSENYFDAVIHAAAVADYKVESPYLGKLDSLEPFTIKLIPNPKIIDQIRKFSFLKNPKIKVIGFKLTLDASADAVVPMSLQKMLGQGSADLVVHNVLSEISENKHPATIYWKNGSKKIVSTKQGLAECLAEEFETITEE